ncbi:MAG TPA: Ig-like domain repeat protein, partial [Promineifilum sp.]|nr:Ig-like domain repeat protein [Promineifilum sp.]
MTATVSGSGGTPTGTVYFYDGSSQIGSTALVNGIATIQWASPNTAQTRSLSAVYPGDTIFQGSVSSTLAQVLQLAPATVTITSSQNPSAIGQSVTLTATITWPGGASVYNSYIQLFDGASPLTEQIYFDGSSGVAPSLTLNNLSLGGPDITAKITGYGWFLADSTSAVYTQTVTQSTDDTVAISNASQLTDARQNIGYSPVSLSATGGTAPYSYELTGGAMPAGLSLSSAGVISGTPSAYGSFSFTVKATDSTSKVGSKTFALTVLRAPTV